MNSSHCPIWTFPIQAIRYPSASPSCCEKLCHWIILWNDSAEMNLSWSLKISPAEKKLRNWSRRSGIWYWNLMVLELNEADLNMYEDKIKSKRDVRMYVKIKRDQKSPCFVCGKGILSIYLTFFSLLTKRQTHKTANATVTTISPGHTGIGQTPVLISLSPW